MYGMSNFKKALILITFAVYMAHLGLNGLAARGGPDNILFPHSVSNVSRKFHLEITPASQTFAIWGVIFMLQICWLMYAIQTIFRSARSANILSSTFYFAFILNVLSLSAWLFVWSRAEGVVSFIVILAAQVFINVAIGLSFIDLEKFLHNNKGNREGNGDIWTQRLLVQNALEFYATWTTVTTMINFAIVLSYYMGLSTRTASVISLSILGLVVALWFIVENFVLLKYTMYTFTVYIVLMIASAGIVYRIFANDKLVGGLALSLLILSSMCFVIRVGVIIVQHNKSWTKYSTVNEKC